MLSYRHAFHAGNFADLHKHAALLLVLDRLCAKDKPFVVIDTHAGGGLYDLNSAEAQKTGEWRAGIGRLCQTPDEQPDSSALLRLTRAVAAAGAGRYPGSPWLARRALRDADRLVLVERHPAEHAALKRLFGRDGAVHLHHRDGLEALPALVPPPERRGLVLIDPSWEVKSDYDDVPRALARAWTRWPTGVFLLWYPLLAAGRHRALVPALRAAGITDLEVSELVAPGHGTGMRGSGLILVNPPFTVPDALAEVTVELGRRLA